MIISFIEFCIYKLLLDFFCFFILGTISYDFVIVYNDEKYVFSWCIYSALCLLVSYWLKSEEEFKISQQIILSLFMFSTVPFIVLFSSESINIDCLLTNLFFIVVFMLIYFAISKSILLIGDRLSLVQQRKLPISSRENVFKIVVVLSVSSVIFTFFYYMGGSLFLDGFNVYNQRALFAQANIPVILRYILGFSNIVELVLLIWLFDRKQYLFAGIMLCVSYIHFSLGGEKTVLFSIVLGVVLFFARKILTKNSFILFFCIVIFGGILTGVLWQFGVIEVPWLASFVRRMFFVPSLLNQYYLDYFSTHQFSFWGLNRDYSIGLGIANRLSDMYLNSPNGFANNGLLGDAYSNAGYIGCIYSAIFLSIAVKLFDLVSDGIDTVHYIGVSVYIAFSLLNTICTTVMVTHGGFVAILLLYCLPRDE